MMTRAAAALCLFLVPLLASSVLAEVVDLSNGEVRFTGAFTGDEAGLHVANAGDVNDDGIDDLLISAPLRDSNGTNAGTVYLVYGSTNFDASIDLRFIESSALVKIIGEDTHDELGRAAAGIGDFNDDGYDDVIVGAHRAGSGSRGKAYVIFGGDALPNEIRLDNLGSYGVAYSGADYGDRAGDAVGPAGDFNGDGIPDIVIGAPRGEHDRDDDDDDDDDEPENRGESYVVFGSSAPTSLSLGSLGANGMVIEGIDNEDRSGNGAWGAGDFNDDGYDDVVIGADRADPHGSQSGEAYVVFGSASPVEVFALSDLDGSSGVVIYGRAASDNFGEEVCSAGDFNGDGIADILISAEDASSDNEGEAYVIFGSSTPAATIEADDLETTGLGIIIRGGHDNAETGESIRFAGDFNLDGFGDVMVGSPLAANGGAAYVIYGSATPDSFIDLTDIEVDHSSYEGGASGSKAGEGVGGSGGDFNGDGAPDLIIGDRDAGGTGEVVLVFGTALVAPSDFVCSVVDGEVQLNWQNGATYDNVQVFRDEALLIELAGDATSYVDDTMATGDHSYCVVGLLSSANSLATCYAVTVPAAVTDLTCCAVDDQLTLNWTNNGAYDGIEIVRDGVVVATLPGTTTSFNESLVAGAYAMEVRALIGTDGAVPASCQAEVVAAPTMASCDLSGLPCVGLQDVDVAWTNNELYDSVEVLRDGVVIATLFAGEETFKDTALADGSYDYGIRATLGCSVASSSLCNAEVLLAELPAIAADPAAADLCEGDDYTFSVAATGSDLVYQWRKDGVDIVDENDATLMLTAVTPADAGDYDVQISNVCGAEISAPAALQVRVAPIVATDPAPQTVCEGAITVFSVAATGSEPLSYQWRKDGVEILGATEATLTLDPTELTDAGDYDVVITNVCGAATSAAVLLSIDEPPYVTAPPIAQAVCAGEPVTFSVAIDSELPVTYQWRKDGVELPGETADQLTIAAAAAADAAGYDVEITNVCGTDLSGNADLVVDEPPTILVNPIAQVVCEGSDVTFEVTAQGSGTLLYQWRKDGVDIVGANATTFDLLNADLAAIADYDVIVTNHCDEATSSAASLTVNVAPTVTAEPESVTVCEDDAILLAVTAAGTEPLTFQWRKDGIDLTGETAPSLSIANAQTTDIASFDVVVTNDCGSATSINADVDVRVPAAIVTEPLAQTLCEGSDVNFSVVASGAEPLAYQWQKNGVDIAGANAADLNLTAITVDAGAAYSVVVTNDCGVANSIAATLTVDEAPEITLDPQGSVVCLGDSLAFLGGATGTEPLSYQWQKDGVDIAGANDVNLNIASAALADAGDYTLVVFNHCGTATSAVANAVVQDPVAIVTAPAAATLCDGETLALSVVATGDPVPTYQWQKDGVDLLGATGSTLEIPAVTLEDAGDYAVLVANPCGAELSAVANVIVEELVAITVQPVATEVCLGLDAQLTVTATGAPPIAYQWQKDGIDLAGENAATLDILNADFAAAGDYAVVVSNGCNTVNSVVAVLTVIEAPTVTLDPSDTTICNGAVVNLTVDAVGSAPLNFQWQKDGVVIPGATGKGLSILNVTPADSGDYRAVVTNDCGAVMTAAASVTVEVPPTITLQPESRELCEGLATTLAVAVDGTDPLTYQWQKDGIDIPGATSSTLAILSLSGADTGSYNVIVTNDCGTATSDAADVLVKLLPLVTAGPDSVDACENDLVEFTVETVGAAPLFYQWQKDGMDLPGETGAVLTIAAATLADAGDYELVLYNDCGTTRSAIATLTVEPLARIVVEPIGGDVCAGADFQLEVAATGNDLTYQWRLDGVDLAGENAATLALTAVQTTESGLYDVVVANGCNTVFSGQADVVVRTAPVVVADVADRTICAGEELIFTVDATGSEPLSYQWQKDGVDLVDETLLTLTIAAIQSGDAGSYQCRISNDCGVANSFAANVVVDDPVAIVTEPVSENACIGDDVELVVVANGTEPLTYQWRKDGVDLIGETAATLTLAALALEDTASYDVVIANACNSVTSVAADLVVEVAPTLTADLSDHTLCAGEALTLAIEVAGSEPLTFEWQKDGVTLVDELSNELTFAAVVGDDTGNYQCVVTNACGEARSTEVAVTVQLPVTIEIQPQDHTVCSGETIALAVAAMGTLPVTYQWRKDGVDIDGATASILTIDAAALADTGAYDVVVTNPCSSETSAVGLVTVEDAPAIVQDLVDQEVCLGDAVTFVFEVNGTEPVTYQWQKDGVDLAGETANELTLATTTGSDAGLYSCIATNACGQIASANADLTLLIAAQITAQPEGVTVCSGELAAFEITAEGSDPLTYQWFKDGVVIAEATGNRLELAAAEVADAGSYSATVSNACGFGTSVTVLLEVEEAPTVVGEASDATVCVGEPVNLSVIVAGSAPLQYQWQKDGVDLVDETALDLDLAAAELADAGSYQLRITNSCGEVFSATAQVIVEEAPSVTADPEAAVACEGDSITFVASANGTEPLTYQWQKDGVDLVGANEANLTLNELVPADMGLYSLVVTNMCGVATTAQADLVIDELPRITAEPESATVCEGDAVTLAITATGAAPLSYQWQKDGVEIDGADQAALTLDAADLNDAGEYQVVVTNDCASVTSVAAAITVRALPAVTLDTVELTLCAGEEFTLAATATGADPLAYQWLQDGLELANANQASLTIVGANVDSAGQYSVVVTNDCGEATSEVAIVDVHEAPTVTQEPLAQVLCEGDPALLTVIAQGTEPISYQWQKDGVDLVGATTNELALDGATADDANYAVVVTNDCGTTTSVAVRVTVNVIPAITAEPADQTVCVGETVSFSVIADSALELSYQWFMDDIAIDGANAADLTVDAVAVADAGNYSVQVANDCGDVMSALANLAVLERPQIDVAPVGTTVCSGEYVEFSVAASGFGELVYQWNYDGKPINGENDASYVIDATVVADSGLYSVTVSNLCGAVISEEVELEVELAAGVLTQPVATTICEGGVLLLEVVAEGSEPLEYQWLHAGVEIAGATEAELTLEDVSAAEAGDYTVRVQNACGAVDSDVAEVTVDLLPTVVEQPTGGVICANDAVELTVVANGVEPFTYQWKKDGVNIALANEATYAIAAMVAVDAGDYTVEVTNSCGSVLSAIASLEFDAGPSIQLHPFSRTICEGEPVSFVVVASGLGELAYQWQKDGVDLDGATEATLTLDAVTLADDGDYNVVVANACSQVTSQAALLAIAEAPAVTTEPAAATVCAGADVTLTVEASGTWPLNYQWRHNGVDLDGEVRATLTLNDLNADAAGDYDVVISNVCGDATSVAAAVIVNDAPLFVEQPLGADLCSGAELTLSAVVSSHENPTFQWFKDGVAIDGADTAELSFAEVMDTDAGDYTVVATNDCGTASSQIAVLTVDMTAEITIDLADQRACEGSRVELAVVAAGAEPLTYQWQLDGVDLSGATEATLVLDEVALADAGEYTVTVSNGCGKDDSSAANLTVTTAPTLEVEAADATVCVGDAAELTVVAAGTAPLSFQWFQDGAAIDGAVDATLALSDIALAAAGDYTVEVSNECGDLLSTAAVLTVNDIADVVTAPADVTVCAGDDHEFVVVAASGAILSYQWQKDGADIAGATADRFEILAADLADAGSYQVVITNTCGAVTSTAAELTVNVAPTVLEDPTGAVACAGSEIELSVDAAGSAPLTYQWQENGVDIEGATAPTLVLEAVTAAADYQVIVSNGCGSQTSAVAEIQVLTAPTFATQPQSQDVCEEDEVVFSVTANGSDPLTYQWLKDGVEIDGADAASLVLAAVTTAEAGDYSVRVSNECGFVTSELALLTVGLLPTIEEQPVTLASQCEGTEVTFAVTASGKGPLSYQWRLDEVAIDGATDETLVIDAVTADDAGSYDVLVTNECGARTSEAVDLVVDAIPVIVEFADSVEGCVGDVVTLSVEADSVDEPTYQWHKNGIDIVGATRESYTLVEIVDLNAGDYSVTVTNSCGSAVSEVAILTVKSNPEVLENPVGDLVELDTDYTFAVVAGGDDIAYQWRHEGVEIDGATFDTLTVAAIEASDAGAYDVVISSGCGSVTSESAILAVGALDSDLVLSCCNADGISSICWSTAEDFDRFLVYSGGVLLADLDGDATCFTIADNVVGDTDYQVWAELDGAYTQPLECTVSVLAAPTSAACEVLDVDGLRAQVQVTWETDESYDLVMVYRNDELVGDSTTDSFVDDDAPGGDHTYRIEGTRVSSGCDSVSPFVTCEVTVTPEPVFRRGDVNIDESINISDTIQILGYVFQDDDAPGCLDAADVNDDGYISVADGIYIINYMFANGDDPPSPGPTECGTDPTDDDDLDCQVTATSCE